MRWCNRRHPSSACRLETTACEVACGSCTVDRSAATSSGPLKPGPKPSEGGGHGDAHRVSDRPVAVVRLAELEVERRSREHEQDTCRHDGRDPKADGRLPSRVLGHGCPPPSASPRSRGALEERPLCLLRHAPTRQPAMPPARGPQWSPRQRPGNDGGCQAHTPDDRDPCDARSADRDHHDRAGRDDGRTGGAVGVPRSP